MEKIRETFISKSEIIYRLQSLCSVTSLNHTITDRDQRATIRCKICNYFSKLAAITETKAASLLLIFFQIEMRESFVYNEFENSRILRWGISMSPPVVGAKCRPMQHRCLPTSQQDLTSNSRMFTNRYLTRTTDCCYYSSQRVKQMFTGFIIYRVVPTYDINELYHIYQW